MTDNLKLFIVTRIIIVTAIVFVFVIFFSYIPKLIPLTPEGKLISTVCFLILPLATFQAVRNVDKNINYLTFNIPMRKISYKYWILLVCLTTLGFIGNILILYILAPILGFLYYSYDDYKTNFVKEL